MTADLPPLIQALTDPSRYGHPVGRIRVLQTHISWVILTGPFAYKIKKPLDLGFLNFSTLERRRFYCEEELRLNRRLAPELYLDLVAITGRPDSPSLDGPGPAIEYAVRMKEFPQEAQLDRMLSRGALSAGHVDAVVERLAAFHAEIPRSPEGSPFGAADLVAKPVQDNFEAIRRRTEDPEELAALDRLENWSRRTHRTLAVEFDRRKLGGFIRECHGDAHLANMAWIDGKAAIFDCIEFSDNLRWIDVISEVAFLTMDLEDRGRPDFASRALDHYLELTGDYGGLSLLRYYQAYRAMVRAKVTSIRLEQAGGTETEREKIRSEYRAYLALAERYARPARPWLAITHGFSGSGKSTAAQHLIEKTGAVRVRTDVERKRLFGLSPRDSSESPIDSGIYTPEATKKTYEKVAEAAEAILSAGFPAIADGTFLMQWQRNRLRDAAEKARAPFLIFDVRASEATLVLRMEGRPRRTGEVSEADLAVLRRQMTAQDPLDEKERALAISLDTDAPLTEARVGGWLDTIEKLLSGMDQTTGIRHGKSG